jgi:methylmalonyl-CoA mutase
MADLTAWRALVEKELAGASFDKLVQKTPEGIALQPLYTERAIDPAPPGVAPFVRGASSTATPFRICVQVDPRETRRDGALADDLAGGADALWCLSTDREAVRAATARGAALVIESDWREAGDETEDTDEPDEIDGVAPEVWSSFDWIADIASGRLPIGALGDSSALSVLPPVVTDAIEREPDWRCLRVGGLPFHDAGADAADELALMLSSLVATLRTLDDAKIPLAPASRLAWAQIAVGRDTFGELCKLRALRLLWTQVWAAAGVRDVALASIHAVCSSRTLSVRDPWVNMLRGTTQVFAAALGGAQLITPLPFDAAFDTTSALGQRVARNTALVLREESQLGRVLDAAGGSYYIEARTDALAREAWSRFQAIERDGGIVQLLRTGALRTRLEAAWAQRASAIAKRKEPVLGVSEFANLNEKLPGTPRPPAGVHRDAEGFEALRARVESSVRGEHDGAGVDGAGRVEANAVSLLLLGAPAEHRGRQGFAESFFAVAGLRTIAHADTMADAANAGRDAAQIVGPTADVTCICGSDERYATDAVVAAQQLRAAGVKRIVLAGRPGALEADLRAAGVDAFIYMGCDVLATLEELFA